MQDKEDKKQSKETDAEMYRKAVNKQQWAKSLNTVVKVRLRTDHYEMTTRGGEVHKCTLEEGKRWFPLVIVDD